MENLKDVTMELIEKIKSAKARYKGGEKLFKGDQTVLGALALHRVEVIAPLTSQERIDISKRQFGGTPFRDDMEIYRVKYAQEIGNKLKKFKGERIMTEGALDEYKKFMQEIETLRKEKLNIQMVG